jgi:hypothetical protein
MPDLPALPLSAPDPRKRITKQTPRPKLSGPGADRQKARLGPALARLTKAFEAGSLGATDEPAANPEQILVLEVAGELNDFVKAINKISGFEFLVEAAMDKIESGDDFAAKDNKGRAHRYQRQLYLVATDAQAWKELLSLWDRFQRGERMPHGKAPFGHLFSRLEDLRTWNDEDRLERSGALEAWSQELSAAPDVPVDFEIELWLRAGEARREALVAQLRADLKEAGGQVVAQSVRPEIGYHGVLARVPAGKLREAVDAREVKWLKTGGVRFFHAAGQLAAVLADDDDVETLEAATRLAPPPPPLAATAARVAVLDGVPLAGHALLAGRIILDDPDGWESLTAVRRRNHGTAMTSIVLHGDLGAGGPAQRRPIYVRPILSNQTPDWVSGEGREELPRDRLPVDVLHAAVVRLFEGEAVAPSVRVIVLAVGDSVCQFDRFVSPMARMIDWLQAEHEIVVLVSAGNHLDDLLLPAEIDTDNPQELQHEVLAALLRDSGLRRLLSPAESVNALTIGAAHQDAAIVEVTDGRVDPLLSSDLPSVVSAGGSGVRRAVKPDVLLPGGRQFLTREPRLAEAPQAMSVSVTRRPPGVRAAAPGRDPGTLDATTSITGTSPATGIAGYHAGHLLDVLEGLRELHGAAMPGPEFDAVLVKAALVHAAEWGAAGTFIDPVSAEVGVGKARDVVARTVGYGVSRPGRVLACDDNKVTVLAASRLAADQAHAYRFPLPASLASVTTERRLTVTLAWLSSINPSHRSYRRAALAVDPGGMPKQFVDRVDVDQHTARRGTVQHDVLVGHRAEPYAADKAIELVVSCRADAGELTTAPPYALIVTLEIPQGIDLPIYQQVQQGLRVPVPVRPRS